MRLLIDASGATFGGPATVAASLIGAWRTADGAAGDELHVIASSRFSNRAQRQLRGCHIHAFKPGLLARLRAQYALVPSVADSVHPDAVLAMLPIVPAGHLPCPIVVVCYDLRHEIRPSEFSRIRLVARAIEYRRAYRRASKIVAISKRTANDLVDRYPQLASKVEVVHLGADHLPAYEGGSIAGPGLALAYAQMPNKRPELAIRAWALLGGTVDNLPVLSVVGASVARATQLRQLAQSLGVPRNLLTIQGVIDEEATIRALHSSRLLVFPSSFEGFGLPVLEALRNKVPVVVSRDAALIEVGGTHVTAAADDSPEALAAAVKLALSTDTVDRRKAGAEWANGFTWRSTASAIRKILFAAT